MNRASAIAILVFAAVLEAGGDAIIRIALRSSAGSARVLMFLLGAVVLFAYGWTVNAPSWDFGRLLGLYVVFFFVTAQLISWLAFHQPPGKAAMAGGILIIAGGLVISLWEA